MEDQDDSGGDGIPPWRTMLYQRISWCEMEQFSADGFYSLARAIEGITVHSRTHPDSEAVPQELSSEDSKHLLGVSSECMKIGLRLSAKYAIKLSKRMEKGATFGERSSGLETLQDRIEDEMEMQLFLHIPSDRADLYNQPELFGKDVNTRFPEIQFDMIEAGNCYAAGRGTASVFHLMRIMEVGVQRLGNKLNVALVQEKNWQNILDEINKAIKYLTKGASTVEMSQAAANLYAVKVAWRNEVMHPKETYTLDEADNLIRQVRIFMQQLANIV